MNLKMEENKMLPGAIVTSIARGQCCCHSDPDCIPANAPVITGSNDCFMSGLGGARVGDIVRNSCGHTGTIVTGSGSVFVNGLQAAFIGSRTIGCVEATIITGTPTVMIG
jgi:uncharacterized Zn-binding protein involved in type VI secretion